MRFLLVVLIFITSVYSQTLEELYAKAVQLFNDKKFDQAYTLLYPKYQNNQYNNQILYLLGFSAYKLNKTSEAIIFYEQLLKNDPNALRVKLDLAKCYYIEKEYDKSKQLLLEVKSTQPPKMVEQNIDSFLHRIEKENLLYNIVVSLGYMYDSNANIGPEDDYVDGYYVPDNYRPKSDYAFKTSLFGILKSDLIGLSWNNMISIQKIDYNDLDHLDTLNGTFTSTLGHKVENFLLQYPLSFSTKKLGHDQKYYSRYIAFTPSAWYLYSERLNFGLSGNFKNQNYYENSSREVNTSSIKSTMRYKINPNIYIEPFILIQKENSKTDYESNIMRSIGLNFNYQITSNINLFLQTNYEQNDYEGTSNREDHKINSACNLSYEIGNSGFSTMFSLYHTKNNSTIDIHNYHRTQGAIYLNYAF